MSVQQKFVNFFTITFDYLIFLWKRSKKDNIKVPAGHLAYVTLLSLVPFLAIVFDILSAFPTFLKLETALEGFIYNNFVPSSGDAIRIHIQGFIENTKNMTVIGIGSLVIIALLLISAIDDTINRIWRCHNRRRKVHAFAIYWTILSLGPIIVGASVALSTYLFSIFRAEGFLSFGQQILSCLPFIFTWLAFAGVYTLVPHQRVSFRYALIGGLVAATLFELGTKVFTLYITNFPSHQVIYGAIAIIPIVFIWVYFSWLIILIGAEVTATLEEFLYEHENHMGEDI
ncbi:virulence factor BrkB family protein [Psychromonas algarum]|uniref:virulence factor BrkB family protein n=1 Tax=Psychromonas algarum TaxID=2555643 RepID=UPI001FBA9210|nr:virulence factor BrkB family protein [Psychromonas sp. RZ22]